MSKINRRRFVSGVPAGVLGLGLCGSAQASTEEGSAENTAAAEPAELKVREYRPLGNTGIKASDVIYGANAVFSSNVIRYASDLGVTLFDTAETYMGGRSEELVGEALEGRRDKAAIITKHGYGPGRPPERQKIIERVEGSLKRLRSDYVDVAFLHNLSDLSLLDNEELVGAYEQLKKDGKVRFTGFSTHSNIKGVLQECDQLESNDFVQAILFSYNHMEGEALHPVIKSLRAKGIGTIAMKTQAGGKQGNLKGFVTGDVSYPQAALSWVLANKSMDCAVITMSTYSHVEEYVAASGTKLANQGSEKLAQYRKEVHDSYCRMDCNRCESVCPANVAISDVLRYAMYFEDYRQERMALGHYSAMDAGRKPLSCADCSGPCVRECPFGLKVRDKLLATHELLSV